MKLTFKFWVNNLPRSFLSTFKTKFMAGKPKASKAKRNSILFKMVSTADTGYFYLARRNPKQKQEKMVFTKYDPIVRKHVEFKEQKLSS
jgi:large subunit ribosomal protein L33